MMRGFHIKLAMEMVFYLKVHLEINAPFPWIGLNKYVDPVY